MIRVSAANSRWSLAVPLALAVSVLGATTRATAQEDCMKTTAVYKQVGDLKIHADVYRPATKDVLPVVVWIHGGALINGHRAGVSGRVELSWVDLT